MPAPLTTTSYALLGLLSVQDWTTYELAKQVARSLRWFWPRAERKLYDEPKRLVDAGLATARIEHTGRRPRTVYSITPGGRTELRRWLRLPPAAPLLESEGVLKVFFSPSGSKADLLQTLATVGEQARSRRSALAVMAEQSLARQDPFPERRHVAALTLRLHVDQELLVEQWAAWAQEQVRSWPSARDAAGWDADAVLARLGSGAPATAERRTV